MIVMPLAVQSPIWSSFTKVTSDTQFVSPLKKLDRMGFEPKGILSFLHAIDLTNQERFYSLLKFIHIMFMITGMKSEIDTFLAYHDFDKVYEGNGHEALLIIGGTARDYISEIADSKDPIAEEIRKYLIYMGLKRWLKLQNQLK